MSGHADQEYSQYAADFKFVMDPTLPADAPEPSQIISTPTYPQSQEQQVLQQVSQSDSTRYYHNRPPQEQGQQAQSQSQPHTQQLGGNMPLSSAMIMQQRYQNHAFNLLISDRRKSKHCTTDGSINQQRPLPREILPEQDPRIMSEASGTRKGQSELFHQQNFSFSPSNPQDPISGINQGEDSSRPNNQIAAERKVLTFRGSNAGLQVGDHESQYKYYHQRNNAGDTDASF